MLLQWNEHSPGRGSPVPRFIWCYSLRTRGLTGGNKHGQKYNLPEELQRKGRGTYPREWTPLTQDKRGNKVEIKIEGGRGYGSGEWWMLASSGRWRLGVAETWRSMSPQTAVVVYSDLGFLREDELVHYLNESIFFLSEKQKEWIQTHLFLRVMLKNMRDQLSASISSFFTSSRESER